MLISGPPELPGLTATSVWMNGRYSPVSRPLALTMPAVTVFSSPNGDPIAITHSPTRSLLESPMRTDGSPVASIFSSGHVAALVGAQQPGLELALVLQRDRDLVGAVDHVGVRQQVAVGRDDEAGPEAARHVAARTGLLLARPLRTLLRRIREEPTEELVHRIVLVEIRHRRPALGTGADAGGGADADDGRTHPLGEVGEVGQRLGRLRRHARRHEAATRPRTAGRAVQRQTCEAS